MAPSECVCEKSPAVRVLDDFQTRCAAQELHPISGRREVGNRQSWQHRPHDLHRVSVQMPVLPSVVRKWWPFGQPDIPSRALSKI